MARDIGRAGSAFAYIGRIGPISVLALGLAAGGAKAESDARLSGGGDDLEITYSGIQRNLTGGGTAEWSGGGGDESAFSHTGSWPGQGDRIAVYGNGSGGGPELTYPDSVGPAPALAWVGVPVR